MKINARQARFAALVVDGNSYATAFKVAYNKPGAKAQAAAHAGHKVASRPLVIKRIKELRGKTEAKLLLTVNERLNYLAADIQAPVFSSADRNARANSIKVYNAMAGGDLPPPPAPPQRVEVTGKDGAPLAAPILTLLEVGPKERLAAMVKARQERAG